MRRISRRTFILASGAVGAAWSALEPMQAATSLSGHNFVIITLQGGVDHSQFLPVFASKERLSESIHFPVRETFEAYGKIFLNVPGVFHPQSALLQNFGAALAVVQGIQMDGQNAHNAALRVLVRGSSESSALSFAAVLGELCGQTTEYGLVSFGTQPFRNAGGLSSRGSGITLPLNLLSMKEQLGFPLGAPGGGKEFISLLANYNKKSPSSLLHHPLETTMPGTDLDMFRRFIRDASGEERETFQREFSLDDAFWKPYEGLAGPYGSDRYQQFAMAAKFIQAQRLGRVFVLNVGRTEGLLSYDTHNAYSNNDLKQQDMLRRDFKALEIFLTQIRANLDQTTVIVGSEFGRPPQLNPAGGRDHWGANNCMLIWSPFVRPGIHGQVDPETYVGMPVVHSDGAIEPLRCRGIYRGFVEQLVDRGLVNANSDTKDRIIRQFLPGNIPSNIFKAV